MADRAGSPARALFRPPFVLAVLVLGACAFVVNPLLTGSAGSMLKEPLPLRKPFRKLPKTLGPYQVFMIPDPLNAAMVEALGTEEYLDRIFEDTRIENRSDPRRWVRVFLAYYTGGWEVVPHVPDDCRVGAGFKPKVKGNLDLEIRSLGRSIPVRALTFEKSSEHQRPTVVYTFHCNGDFAADRTTVRFRTNSPTETYAYYCKIELSFGLPQSRPANPARQESIQAAGEFLSYLLPELLGYLPDWEAANRGPRTASETVSTSAETAPSGRSG
jgi:hypothetical protein